MFLGNKSITYFNGKNLENKLYEYSNYKRRFYVDTVFNFLENSSKRCVELFGLRRVGKTVSIFHIIDKLIKSNVSSNEILYIECNESLSDASPLQNWDTSNVKIMRFAFKGFDYVKNTLVGIINKINNYKFMR